MLLPANDKVVKRERHVLPARLKPYAVQMGKPPVKAVLKPDDELMVDIDAGVTIQTNHFQCVDIIIVYKSELGQIVIGRVFSSRSFCNIAVYYKRIYNLAGASFGFSDNVFICILEKTNPLLLSSCSISLISTLK